MFARRGPGLVGMAARTAVVAGTATAVSGRVARRQQRKYGEQDAEYVGQQAAAMEQGFEQGAVAGRAGLHGRAPAARPAEDAGDPHRRGVPGQEEADPRHLTPGRRLAGQALSVAATPGVVDHDSPVAVRAASKDVGAVAAHFDRRSVERRALQLPAVLDKRHVAGGQDLGDLASHSRLQRDEQVECGPDRLAALYLLAGSGAPTSPPARTAPWRRPHSRRSTPR